MTKLEAKPEAVEVDLSQSAVAVVDMQNAFASKNGMLGRVEDWRGVPKVWPICLLPVSSGSASLAEP